MKSHVRENIVKNFIASQMHFKQTGQGYKEVKFDEFARGLIDKQLAGHAITLSEWRIYDGGMWGATVTETGHTVQGNDIYDVISNAISEEGEENDI